MAAHRSHKPALRTSDRRLTARDQGGSDGGNLSRIGKQPPRREHLSDITDDSGPDLGREDSQNLLQSATVTTKDEYFLRIKTRLEQGAARALGDLRTRHEAAVKTQQSYKSDLEDLFAAILGSESSSNNVTETANSKNQNTSGDNLENHYQGLVHDTSTLLQTYKTANDLVLTAQRTLPAPTDNSEVLDRLATVLEQGYMVAKADVQSVIYGSQDPAGKAQTRDQDLESDAIERARARWSEVLGGSGLLREDGGKQMGLTRSRKGVVGVLEDAEKATRVMLRNLPASDC